MLGARLPTVLAAAMGLLAAGCVAPAADLGAQSVGLGLDLRTASTPLWADPQNAPHPAFGWPTLVNPGEGEGLPAFWKPIPAAELPDHIAGLEHVASLDEELGYGAGIAIFGSLVVVPSLAEGSFVFDISDPAAPALLGQVAPSEGQSHRGAAFLAYPDGRLVAAVATSAGFDVLDLTDPTAPTLLTNVTIPNGGHKLGIVPGTPILYNANSQPGFSQSPEGGSGVMEIFDLTDPAAPRHVQDFPNGFGCHHVYFWNSAEKQRAICAGMEFTQIMDIADPLNPVVIVSVPVHHGNPDLPSTSIWTNPGMPLGVFMFSHFAILNDEGNVLIVGDEAGGGAIPPGCIANAQTPARDVSTPFGALWFYDVSDETDPQLLGWFSPGLALAQNPPDPNEPFPLNVFYNCTAHHGRLVPDPEGRDLLAMSFYRSGVVLVDFTDPSAPSLVDQFVDGTNTWETWYYNGYLFTGDMKRGLDVLSFV